MNLHIIVKAFLRNPAAIVACSIIAALPACDGPSNQVPSMVSMLGESSLEEVSADAPSSEGAAKRWVEAQVHAALARHGTVKGDEWMSVYAGNERDSKGKSVYAERVVVIKGIVINCSPLELSDADKLNNFQWAFDIDIAATAFRYGDARSASLGEWSDGKGPLGIMILGESRSIPLRAQKQKGEAVAWNRWSLLGFSQVTTSQVDFFEQEFENFQQPNTDPANRAIVWRIRNVLRQDNAASAKVAGDGKPLAEVRERYVPMMLAIDLGGCPEEFSDAYRAHIQAWRDVDSAAIGTTWERVVEVARQHGSATFFRKF